MNKHKLILSTFPNKDSAMIVIRTLLEQRFVACANILSNIESWYWWQNKIENSNEVLVLFKTPHIKCDVAMEAIQKNHPYETPEVIVVDIDKISEKYQSWLICETNSY